MAAQETYNDKVVRQFAIMTVVWGIVGMLVGVFIAAQMAWPALNFDIPWLTFSRLRPLHTNAVVFALAAARCSRPPITSSSAPAMCGCSPTGLRPSASGAGRR